MVREGQVGIRKSLRLFKKMFKDFFDIYDEDMMELRNSGVCTAENMEAIKEHLQLEEWRRWLELDEDFRTVAGSDDELEGEGEVDEGELGEELCDVEKEAADAEMAGGEPEGGETRVPN